jgi:hypothetical protein
MALVLFVEIVCARHVRFLEEARIFALEDCRPGGAADPVSRLIARGRRGVEERAKQPHVQVSFCCKEAGGEQQRVARQKYADQQPGFGKDDDRAADVPRPRHEGVQVAKLVDQVIEHREHQS